VNIERNSHSDCVEAPCNTVTPLGCVGCDDPRVQALPFAHPRIFHWDIGVVTDQRVGHIKGEANLLDHLINLNCRVHIKTKAVELDEDKDEKKSGPKDPSDGVPRHVEESSS